MTEEAAIIVVLVVVIAALILLPDWEAAFKVWSQAVTYQIYGR